MRVFIESKARFIPHLRPEEVFDAIQASSRKNMGYAEIETALSKLCEWGHLQTHPDTSEVTTVEDFYKARYVIQITSQGEAAERAIELFQSSATEKGELQNNAVADILDLLRELKQISEEQTPDPGRTHRNLILLDHRFEQLAGRAQLFMSGLQRKIDLRVGELDQFASYTQRLIEHIEQFVSELVIASENIAQIVLSIESAGLEKLFQIAAERSIGNDVEATPADRDENVRQWHSFWNRFRAWFIPTPGCPSNSDLLRGRARAAVRALLSVITSVNDRKISRIDGSNDFRVLARWFVAAESDEDAHRLWRVAFGLSPARHLIVNEATLDNHESQEISSDTSWLDAPPLQVSERFRASGIYSRTGRLSRIVDRTAEKEKLAAATHREALRILSAQDRFATNRRMRLSELAQLEAGEFDLFLDLLGEAVSASILDDEPSEILSNDGSLRITLEPTHDGRSAVIQTPCGTFSGPDHWISIERSSAEEMGEMAL